MLYVILVVIFFAPSLNLCSHSPYHTLVGVVLELEDSGFSHLAQAHMVPSADLAFQRADVIVLIEAHSDVVAQFTAQCTAIASLELPHTRVW